MHTRQTVAASIRDPLDANSLPDLQANVLGTGTEGYNGTHTFVAADLSSLSRSWQPCPSIAHYSLVAVTYS